MAHMIAHAIGGPPQRDLAQIAGANDPPAMLTCKAEQVIGSQARLHILESDIVDGLAIGKGMADVRQHQRGGGLDVHLLRRDLESVHQPPGIGSRAFRSAETGHGVTANGGARQTEAVAGLGSDDQRMGAVQPA